MKKIYLSVLMMSFITLNSCRNAYAEKNTRVGDIQQEATSLDYNKSTATTSGREIGSESETLHKNPASPGNDPIASPAAGTKIQVAILLDTSSSMDGLIEQAKSRL